jgi:hypothetical protein
MLSAIGRFFTAILNAKQSMYQSELEMYLNAKNPKSPQEVEQLITMFNRRRQFGAC